MELHILEIPKIKKLGIDVSKDELALWLSFINNPRDKEVIKMVKKGSALEQAMKELKNLSGDPGFSELVQARAKEIMDETSFRSAAKRQGIREGYEQGKQQGIEQGIKEGKKQGMKEGEKQSKKEIAKKLLSRGEKTEEIIEITGLTKEEIENL